MKTRKFLKKTLAVVLTFAMLAPIMGNLEVNVKKVQAEETTADDSLNVKCQVTQGVVKETTIDKYEGKYVMRFVSAIEDYQDYKEIGFKLIEEGTTKEKKGVVKTVFKRIESTTGSTEDGTKETYNYSPKVIDTAGEYFMTAKLPIDNTEAAKATKYTVWAYGIKKDGTKVNGPERCVSVNDGLEGCKTINMSFDNTSAISVSTGESLTANGLPAEVIGVSNDGKRVHVRITPGETVLKSATLFEFKEGDTKIGEEIFRNLNTKYTGTADTSWYDVYKNTTDEFVIATSADLYGVASAVSSDAASFKNKTIYVVSDIEANKGYADKTNLVWDTTKNADGEALANNETGTQYSWNVIASTSKRFNGTFDGQMHTISGLYLNASGDYQGMFSATDTESTIKDFYLKNSCFQATSTGTGQLGSIVGNAKGTTFTTVYSDAIVVGYCNRVGGLIGSTSTNGGVVMTDCWFAGSATINSAASYLGGLIGAVEASSTITNSLNTGEVYHKYKATTITKASTAGFVGYAGGSVSISNSVNKSDIKYEQGQYIGLFVGEKVGGVTLTNCHSINTNDNLVGFSATYDTCTEQNAEDVAGVKALTTANVKELFSGDYWAICADGLPTLTSFLNGVYVNAQPVDITWYDASKKEYVLKDAGDLYGFAILSRNNTFEGKTIKLGADIEVNRGLATETGWDKNAVANGTDLLWYPIGSSSSYFNGTFDGQMHTISGIYLDASSAYQGLFSATADKAEIKNFYLKNSYFVSRGSEQLGSIVGFARGSYDTIYSDAIVVSEGANIAAGMIGGTAGSAGVAMSNCWFDGSVICNVQKSYFAGFIGRVQKDSTLTNCLNTGNITHNATGVTTNGTAGFVGQVTSAGKVTLTHSVNVGEITVQGGASYGYFVGKADGTVIAENSHSYILKDLKLVYGIDNGDSRWNTCGRYQMSQVSGLNALAQDKIGKLFTEKEARGYWSITKESFPVLTTFESESQSPAQAVDTRWYDASESEYTLMDSGDLYGFAMLSQTNAFKDKTIKLGADIVVNKGTAAEWGSVAPDFAWLSIGGTNAVTNATTPRFAGKFDGQMHTISGIYLNTSSQWRGLFAGTASGSEIKNLYLKNSFFYSTNSGLASIVGNGIGTLETIYSNAYVWCNGANVTGGMVGSTSDAGGVTMNNCWFAGEVKNVETAASHFGGLIGRVFATSTMNNCLLTGYVESMASQTSGVGSMVGRHEGGTLAITNSLNAGTLVKTSTAGSYGLLVGSSANSANMTATNSHSVNLSGWSFVSGADNNASKWSTCGRYSISDVVGYNSLSQSKIGKLLTEDETRGYWSVTHDSFPILTAFAKESDSPVLDIDTSWYDATKNEYILKDVADLYGFALLSRTTTFTGKTIKLGADIEVNKGKATATGWDKTAVTNGTDFLWYPIGSTSSYFNGTFDGQMHTISGIYLGTSSSNQGLFAATDANANIKNFYLKNSYFVSRGGTQFGSVVGNARGTFDTIYSDAIVVSEGCNQAGGIIGGTAQSLGITVKNCWFAGSVICNAPASYFGGFIGIVQKDSTILNCLNTGSVINNGNVQTNGVGAFAGYVVTGKLDILHSINNGTLSVAGGQYFGYFVGRADATVNAENSHSYNPRTWNFVYGKDNGTYATCGRYQVSGVAGINSLTEAKIGKLFTEEAARGYWSITDDSFPVLATFAKESDSIVQAVDASWYDASKNEFTLMDSGDLYGFAMLSKTNTFENKTIKLGADIRIAEGSPDVWSSTGAPTFTWIRIGDDDTAFAGTFDGQMHTISGIYVDTGSSINAALFAQTGETATVKNLYLKDSFFTATTARVASVAGTGAGKFYNIYSNAVVESNNQWIGGMIGIGSSAGVEMERCWFNGKVLNTTNNKDHMGKGGLIGIQNGGTASIVNCLNTGEINVSVFNAVTSDSTNVSPRVGGLVGYVTNSTSMTIDGCLNIGSIKLHDDVNHGYGRLVGHKSANCAVMISNSYATTNLWTEDDPIQTTVSYEIVSEDAIKGAAAVNAMPLLDWTNDWKCGETGEFPQIIFSEDNIGQNLNYSASADDKLILAPYSTLQLAYGDMHAHAKESHGSDAFDDTYTANALSTWKSEMSGHGLDFAASLDHHQTDHILNSEWDTNLFIYGTEPSTCITDIKNIWQGKLGEMHYNMLFAGESKEATKEKLDNVLKAFSDQYNSTEYPLKNSKYEYGNFTKAQFSDLIVEVQNQGGFFVIPHPNLESALLSNDWRDFDFGVDKVGFEVIARTTSGEETQLSYKYWKNLLATGRKYYACSGSDIHGSLNGAGQDAAGNYLAQKALTSVYVSAKNSVQYMEQFKDGNFTAGSVGIKMCIGNSNAQTTMGGECDFNGKRLVVEVGGLHKGVAASGRKYHVDIVTDKGVIYSKPISLTDIGTDAAYIALDTDEQYKFYRVEVIDENGAVRIGYGNPIWNTTVVAK